MTHDVTIDTSERSVVAVCTCGAREVATAAAVAYDWATLHVRIAHPDPVDVAPGLVDRLRAGRHRYR